MRAVYQTGCFVAEARTGTVTLLFTDQVGSTELRQQLGDDATELLRRAHFSLLREVVAARGGEEVKTMGDGLMVAFPSALQAVGCAIAMQQAVDRYNASRLPGEQLAVRIGLDVGEPTRDEHDYFGTPVVVAKRLCDSADGGQIRASELVRRLIGSRGGHSFRDLGALSLKGMAEAVTACEVLWEPATTELRSEAMLPASEAPALPGWLVSSERTPFAGRELELARLQVSWERAKRATRQLVFIEGEPGIGKTRLAGEFALAAIAEGARVLFGRCDEQQALPYRPFAEALRHLAGPEGTSLGPLSLDNEGSERESYELFEAVDDALSSVATNAPLILMLDDLQWAPKPTLLLLRHLALSKAPARLLIAGTFRAEGLAWTHPLSELLNALHRERACERIALPGLGEREAGELIRGWGGSESPPLFTRAVLSRTEGNPFFIEEILGHLSQAGAIYQEGGRLATSLSLDQMKIPTAVKDMIGHRLARLSEDCGRLLVTASVIGREFSLGALQRMQDVSLDLLLQAIDEAIAAGIVREVEDEDDRYAFTHTLIRETLYDELTATRRLHLHRRSLHYAEREGVRLAFEILGHEGPLLLVTGVSNCPAMRARNAIAEQRWDRISRFCRPVLYDRRGVGSSDAPDAGYSLRASVEDLRAVMDAAGSERAFLWGAVDGGPLAIAFAVQYPDRVAGLILLGTGPRIQSSDDFALGVERSVSDSFVRMSQLDQGRAAEQLARVRYGPATEVDAVGEVLRGVPRLAWQKIVGAIAVADVRDILEQVRAPTLIVHDPGNTYIPVAAAHYLAERIPGSRLEICEEAGRPLFGELLFATIQAFIEEAAGSDHPPESTNPPPPEISSR